MQTDSAVSDVSSTSPVPPAAARTAAATRARTTHGMYSKDVVILDEDPDEFEALRREYHEDWNPWGKTEQRYVDNLAAAQWKLDRLNAEEAGIYIVCEGANPPPENAEFNRRAALTQCDSVANQNPLARTRNHYTKLSNIISRTIRDLILLQKERPKDQRRGGFTRFEPNLPRGSADSVHPAESSGFPQTSKASMAWTKMTDRGPGAPKPPPPGTAPSPLNPQRLTAWQQECEELEARDDAMRVILDRTIRKPGEN